MKPGRYSILLLDDDAASIARFEQRLTSMGHTVQVMRTGESVLAAARAGGYDVVFAELLSPSIDGEALLRDAQAIDLSVPIVMMTTDPEVDDVVAAWRAGAADFVRKPTSRRELLEAVERALGAARPVARAPTEATPAVVGYTELDGRRVQVLERVRKDRVEFPVAPKLVARLTRLVEAEDPDPELVFRLLEADAFMGNAVIQVACSPEFRGQHAPSSVREAATRLGARRALASAASLLHRANFDAGSGALGGFASELWLVHYVASVIAELLARLINLPQPAQLQMMTLFAQTGELSVLRVAEQLWPEGLADGRPVNWLSRLVRRCRVEAGAEQVKRWGLSDDLVRFVEAHGDVSGAPRSMQALVQISLGARVLAEQTLDRNPFALPDEPTETPKVLALLEPHALAEVAQRAVARARYVLEIDRSTSEPS